MNDLAGFVALAIVVIVTPGSDTALTIRNTLLGGRPAGVATAVGVGVALSGMLAVGPSVLTMSATTVAPTTKTANAAYGRSPRACRTAT